jgi:hypothetical protein
MEKVLSPLSSHTAAEHQQAGFSFKSHTPKVGRHFVGQPAGALDATGGPSASIEILHQAPMSGEPRLEFHVRKARTATAQRG